MRTDFISQEILLGAKKVSGQKNALYGSTAETETESLIALTPHQRITAGRKKLPVYAYREEFLKAVQEHKVLIVVGETGSGKTTQLPQFLHEAGWSKVYIQGLKK